MVVLSIAPLHISLTSCAPGVSSLKRPASLQEILPLRWVKDASSPHPGRLVQRHQGVGEEQEILVDFPIDLVDGLQIDGGLLLLDGGGGSGALLDGGDGGSGGLLDGGEGGSGGLLGGGLLDGLLGGGLLDGHLLDGGGGSSGGRVHSPPLLWRFPGLQLSNISE